MKPKVIGLGFHKTGTATLGSCLRLLGYNHISVSREAFLLYQASEIPALLKLMEYFDSFENWPWPFIYREAFERFPDSRFILTTRRNEDVWFDSLSRHVRRGAGDGFKFRKYIYGYENPDDNRQLHINKYLKHNQDVRDFFAGKSGSFLEVCWEAGHGWKELCEFLQKDVPDAPFPHSNRDSSKLGALPRIQRRIRSAARVLLKGA
jgi:Sulfotransferase domain